MVSYFILNFMPLMILLALLAMMFVNRDVKIPATNLFTVSIIIMLAITVISTFNTITDISGLSPAEAERVIWFHTLMSTLSYILRPCLILTEILIVINDSRFRFLCVIPAAINAVIITALALMKLHTRAKKPGSSFAFIALLPIILNGCIIIRAHNIVNESKCGKFISLLQPG